MIVGTAGHIDHGKTALVHALTGTDTDRLPEEKRRGITIELGYAAMKLDGGEAISFVDVPGHEKLVRTMVAGASGIDAALLLVAADDGVMPQTLEHLNILRLLNVQRGAVVLTKMDRVDAAALELRQAEVQALLAANHMSWPVFAVCAPQGLGLPELRQWLTEQASQQHATPPEHAGFRMGLDRAFSLSGIGTVVAGSIAAGHVSVGDALCLAHKPDAHWRVRSLQSHQQSVQQAQEGQRCAIGLAGLEREQVERGQTLCAPEIALVSTRVDVQLVASHDATTLRSGLRVHLHVGTQDVEASLALLGQSSLAPGDSALAQLVLHQSASLWRGERFVLRDASATRTLAGGMVLDPLAPARYRQTPRRLAQLQALMLDDPTAQLQALLAQSPLGVSLPLWQRINGFVTSPANDEALQSALVDESRNWALSHGHAQAHEARLLDVLREWHARLPQDMGPDMQRARKLTAPRMEPGLWTALVEQLRAQGKLACSGLFVNLPGHAEQLREADRIVAQKALPMLLQGRFDPPWVRDIAGTARIAEAQVRQVLTRLSKTGEVFQIVKDLFYHPQVVHELAELARQIEREDGAIEAARFRDMTGLGRKRAIQILEFFDRIGFLRRVGDQHLLRPGTALFPERAKR